MRQDGSTSRAKGAAARLVVSVLAAAVAGACSSLPSPKRELPAYHDREMPRPSMRMEQFSTAGGAVYRFCTNDCPVPTPKRPGVVALLPSPPSAAPSLAAELGAAKPKPATTLDVGAPKPDQSIAGVAPAQAQKPAASSPSLQAALVEQLKALQRDVPPAVTSEPKEQVAPRPGPEPFRADPALLGSAKRPAAPEAAAPPVPPPGTTDTVHRMSATATVEGIPHRAEPGPIPAEKVQKILDWLEQVQRQSGRAPQLTQARFVVPATAETVDVPARPVTMVRAREPGDPLPPETVAPGDRGTIAPRDSSNETPEDVIRRWAREWSARNPDIYFANYADGFVTPDGSDYPRWKARRAAAMDRLRRIDVTIEPLKVTRKGDNMLIRFIQTFRSPSYNARVIKLMELVPAGGSWKIRVERIVGQA
jgi:hypothetical protein